MYLLEYLLMIKLVNKEPTIVNKGTNPLMIPDAEAGSKGML